ncbi:MAG: hypothetical protein ACUZ9M_00795 [Candidatus Scalindua sp.]
MGNIYQDVIRLEAEVDYLKPYEIAVKKRHNGYDPENELCPEPDSPEQALQDLQDGSDATEDMYVKDIVKLQAELDKTKLYANGLENAQGYLDEKIEQLQAKLDKLKLIGQKYNKATEFFDKLIENRFVELPMLARKFVQQIGNEILEALKGGEE